MALFESVLVFVVGLFAGTVVRWVAGLAAIVALVLVVLGVATPDIGIVNYVLDQYYLGNELLFISGFLFGIDAATRTEAVGEG